MNREIRKCSVCGHYSRQLSRCLLGKINPSTIKGGVDAVSFMGFSYICGYAKHYEKIRSKLIKRIQKSTDVMEKSLDIEAIEMTKVPWSYGCKTWIKGASICSG